jgi:hypothetical protein
MFMKLSSETLTFIIRRAPEPKMVTLIAIVLSLLLVAATVLIHYEFLRATSVFSSRLTIPRRTHILVVIGGVLVAHLVEVTLYAATYYFCEVLGGIGHIDGLTEGGALDHFYFSITTFTTLGIGDVHPRGALRLIAGVGSLNGLVMIGWSASFTYLSMEQFWADKVHLSHHGLRPRRR